MKYVTRHFGSKHIRFRDVRPRRAWRDLLMAIRAKHGCLAMWMCHPFTDLGVKKLQRLCPGGLVVAFILSRLCCVYVSQILRKVRRETATGRDMANAPPTMRKKTTRRRTLESHRLEEERRWRDLMFDGALATQALGPKRAKTSSPASIPRHALSPSRRREGSMRLANLRCCQASISPLIRWKKTR